MQRFTSDGRKMLFGTGGLGLLFIAAPLWAHHAFEAEYDQKNQQHTDQLRGQTQDCFQGLFLAGIMNNPLHRDLKTPTSQNDQNADESDQSE